MPILHNVSKTKAGLFFLLLVLSVYSTAAYCAAPVITSNGGGSTAVINVQENTTSVTTVVATDADAGTTLTYSIVGGADQGLFSIGGSSGVLAFKTAPDYENPADSDGDGNYEVTVAASDGSHTVDQAITVTVTDVAGQFQLAITVTGNGQVDASASPTPLGGSIAACMDSSGSCQADYAPNATVSLTATPATGGWHFEQWSSDCSGAAASTNVSMDATKTCAATFAIDQYTLSYSAGAHGSINGAASQTVAYGVDGNAVTAAPDANYRFVQWSDGSTSNPRTDTNVTSNLTISASFASTIVTAAPVPTLDWRTLLILVALLSLVAQAHIRRTKRAGG